MGRDIFQWRSLKTKGTVFTLAIFLISIWSPAFYASKMLREDVQQLLGEQQLSTVSLLATQVNQELDDRLKWLERVAEIVTPDMLGKPVILQGLLEQRLILLGLFNGGVIAYRHDGMAIAEVPLAAGRRGINYADRDYIVGPLRDGKSTIGRPHVSVSKKFPEFVMAVPIRDARGRVIGVLSGVTDLSRPNFLDKLIGNRYGQTGGYLLVAPQHRLIVSATDKSRVMEASPAPGLFPLIDRFIAGYEGSGVSLNPLGVEVLASVKRVPVAGWYVNAALPTAEAFAPIRAMQQRMLLATLFLTLLAGGLAWWMVRRQLSPMLAAVRALASFAETNQRPQPLPVTSQDEIGELIGGFNGLLETLGKREAALTESEKRFQALSTMSSDWFWQQDENFRFVEFAGAFSSGFTPLATSLGKTRWELNINLTPEQWAPHRATLEAHLPFRNLEYAISDEHGETRWYTISGEPLFDEARQFVGYHGTGRNISGVKLAEQHLRIAATAFESQEGTFITDAARVILRVNRAFSEITGYSAEEALGQTPRLLSSGRHDAPFYAAMTENLQANGTWKGEIWNKRKNGEIYPQWLVITAVCDDAGQVTHYVGIFSDITSRKAAQEEINSLAFYDPLTALPNRRLLRDRLKQAMAASTRSEKYGALLFVDLDNFKVLNDTLGHDIGDLLLQQVALRLSACVREGDTVARLGGDEFVLMLEDLSEHVQEAANQTEAVGEKILAVLNEPYQLASYVHHSTPSIGVTLFADHQGSIDDLLKRADLAMYQAKASGRNALRFFDPEMQAVVSARVALEAALREAVQHGQFHLFYQAQVDDRGGVTGAEALLRWQHPQRGLVSPAEFIPLAEETGLILPLGHWVLETACAQLVGWATRPQMAHLTVAVNVSARQLHQPDFVEQVLAVLQHTGADPQRLKLELTESLLVDDVEDVIAKMSALKAQGVGFSLDDFGTGYSSLSYLKRLPLEQLKIDQSFVRDVLADPNDAFIARTIITLARSLGLGAIAEGVETVEQRDFLADSGCNAYQGYFFSRPLPIDGFEAFAQSSQH